jgi:hypothetical protein
MGSRHLLPFVVLGAALAASCGSNTSGNGFGDDGGHGDGGLIGDDSNVFGDGSSGEGGYTGDPKTCSEAASSHSYIGCDYWPTVVGNQAWSIFDYAVVVANAGDSDAQVTVTGPANTNTNVTVPMGSLQKIYLPWVSILKGPDQDVCTAGMAMMASVKAASAAYHLVSSVPVTVYQFSALEYKGAGGPSGKDWSQCPGNNGCVANGGTPVGCFSFTNDASLLLPSTAMTGNYRITGHGGWAAAMFGSYFAVTGTKDGTNVQVKISTTGTVLAGGGINATSAGGTLSFSLNAGDVAEIIGDPIDQSDLSGSLLTASAPVQVITGIQCLNVPDNAPACDHTEESNFPAETLGKDYIVTQPTGPNGNAVGHLVRIYGNFDGTNLKYTPTVPGGCPTTINAGQVVECGIVNADFEVTGDHAFAVGMWTQGASVVDPGNMPPNQKGDPDQSLATAVEQYRSKYVFLAPDDYDVSYIDVIAPQGASLNLDGAPVTVPVAAVGSGAYGVYRIPLGPGQAGAHVLTSGKPVGLQVMGYGAYTSYMYPGGLDLSQIAPPPPK